MSTIELAWNICQQGYLVLTSAFLLHAEYGIKYGNTLTKFILSEEYFVQRTSADVIGVRRIFFCLGLRVKVILLNLSKLD